MKQFQSIIFLALFFSIISNCLIDASNTPSAPSIKLHRSHKQVGLLNLNKINFDAAHEQSEPKKQLSLIHPNKAKQSSDKNFTTPATKNMDDSDLSDSDDQSSFKSSSSSAFRSFQRNQAAQPTLLLCKKNKRNSLHYISSESENDAPQPKNNDDEPDSESSDVLENY